MIFIEGEKGKIAFSGRCVDLMAELALGIQVLLQKIEDEDGAETASEAKEAMINALNETLSLKEASMLDEFIETKIKKKE